MATTPIWGFAEDVATSVPILPSADLERTRAFYCFLGFTVVDAADEYLRLRFDDAEVHFYPAPDTDPADNASGWYGCAHASPSVRAPSSFTRGLYFIVQEPSGYSP